MINYYEILGLSDGAGSLEIKNAFRRLAKLYHPDKNPNGKEQFNKILKAYEILSDPIQKSTYDYRLKHQSTSTEDYEPKNTGTKTWRFDEKELKRRQYYNDYIKKQTKEAEDFENVAETKKTYNDYKSIFFATPLAVILFLLIMRLATPYQTMSPGHTGADSTPPPVIQPQTGDTFYSDFFGPQQYDSLTHNPVSIKNKTRTDVIVCLFSKKRFLRSAFVKNFDSFDMLDVPGKTIIIKYYSGLNFDRLGKIKDLPLNGTFTDQLHFYRGLSPLKLKTTKELFLETNHDGFVEITREEFFKK